MSTFRLVDFAARFQRGFRNHVVRITEVPALMEKFEHYGCYATYFFYSDEVLTYMSMRGADSSPTIAGFNGKVWPPYLPIDLDHRDLPVVIRATRLLVSYVTDRWGIDPRGLQVYFSGSKGFHLMLDTRLFGRVAPSKSLPMAFAAMRQRLAHLLPPRERETVDLGIKDRVRLLRLPNTIHEKSGLYKIQVPLDQLNRLNPEEIIELARKPQALLNTDETGLLSKIPVQENPDASRLYHQVRRQVRQITRNPFRYRFHRSGNVGFACKGMQAIWDSHVDPGGRNNCAIRLASEFRLCGLAEEETHNRLFDWNTRQNIGLPDWELEHVVRSAYQHRFPYRYGCRDGALRSFCPLNNLAECQRYVSDQHREQAAESNPDTREEGGPAFKACP